MTRLSLNDRQMKSQEVASVSRHMHLSFLNIEKASTQITLVFN